SVNTGHAYAAAGSYSVTLTVTDDSGAQANDTAMVTVTDVPVAVSGQWANRVGGTNSDLGRAVVIEDDGTVVVGGRLSSAISSQEIVAKYSARGTQLWSRTSNGTGVVEVYGLADDAAGNIVVAGRIVGTVDLGGGGDDIGHAVAADGSGGVFVTGFFMGRMVFGTTILITTAGSNNVFVAKLDATTGAPVWARGYGSTANERGYGIAVDRRGDL